MKLPALRERREDIPLLARHFADRQGGNQRIAPYGVLCRCPAILEPLPYPGNIRELKNLVERTILVSGKPLPMLPTLMRSIFATMTQVTEGAALVGMTLDRNRTPDHSPGVGPLQRKFESGSYGIGYQPCSTLIVVSKKYNITM